jgi:hypothetical protein
MRLLKLFALLATLMALGAAAALAQNGRDFQAVLRPAAGGPHTGSGLVDFRQPHDAHKIAFLDVSVQGLAPNRSYNFQRAVDTHVDDHCTGTNWLTLGQGSTPQSITTDTSGAGRALFWRDLSALPTGAQFDIYFRVIDAATSAVVLESDCDQFRALY